MKMVVGALGAGIIAAALFSSPADAANCVWNGYTWHCWQRHSELRSDRARVHNRRAEVRHDRRHLQHLRARLHRDSYSGSSADVRHDRHAVRRWRHELRQDRRDLRHARREFRRDRWGE